MTQGDVFDADGSVQQARLTRLVIAFFEGDEVQAGSVFVECGLDARGELVATQAVLMAAVADIAGTLFDRGEPADVVEALRMRLAGLEIEEK